MSPYVSRRLRPNPVLFKRVLDRGSWIVLYGADLPAPITPVILYVRYSTSVVAPGVATTSDEDGII